MKYIQQNQRKTKNYKEKFADNVKSKIRY